MRNLSWIMGPTQLISWGISYYAFSVFLEPMSQSIGWSMGQLNGAFSAALLACALSGLVLGRLFDKYGPQKFMVAGAALVSILLLVWSATDQLFVFYLVWIGIGICMPCIQYDAVFWIINNYSPASRQHKLLAIVTFFGGLASTVLIPLTSLLVFNLDWRNALLVLAVLFAVGVGLPFSFLPRLIAKIPRIVPKPPNTNEPAGALYKNGSFWLVAVAMALSGLAWTGLTANILFVGTRNGTDPVFVAAIISSIGVVQLIGRFGFGILGGRFSASLTVAFLSFFQAIGVALLLVLPPTLNLIAFAVFFGIGHGVMTPARATLVTQNFGALGFGRVNGAVNFATSLGRACGPIAFGLSLDMFSVSEPALIGAMLASLIAMVLFLFLLPSQKREDSNETRP